MFAIWLTMMACTVTYLVLVNVLFGLLRRQHAEVWTSLGNPSFWNNSPRNGFLFVRWLLRRDYKKLGDQTIARIGIVAEALFWIVMVLFLLFAVGVFTHR